MSIILIVTLIAIPLVLTYIACALHAELKWAESEIQALKKTIDVMNTNRSLQPSTSRRSETLILRK